jgi:hypothetical protein
VDLGNTCQLFATVVPPATASGVAYAASGALIGFSYDGLNSDAFTNVMIAGNAAFASGQLRVAVQTSDTDTSGTYTDPTSGLAQFPTSFQSGGIVILNSGQLGGGLLGAFVSGQSIQSGFAVSAAFQRPHRFARANVLSGDFFAGPLTVSFINNLHTTGSGGGYTLSPSSGTVNV